MHTCQPPFLLVICYPLMSYSIQSIDWDEINSPFRMTRSLPLYCSRNKVLMERRFRKYIYIQKKMSGYCEMKFKMNLNNKIKDLDLAQFGHFFLVYVRILVSYMKIIWHVNWGEKRQMKKVLLLRFNLLKKQHSCYEFQKPWYNYLQYKRVFKLIKWQTIK